VFSASSASASDSSILGATNRPSAARRINNLDPGIRRHANTLSWLAGQTFTYSLGEAFRLTLSPGLGVMRAAKAQGLQPANHKRVYRVMKAHRLLLQRHAGGAEERRHDGRIAVDRSNLRWCLIAGDYRMADRQRLRIRRA